MQTPRIPAVALLATLAAASVPAQAAILNPNNFASLGVLNLTDTTGAYTFDTSSQGAPVLEAPDGSVLFTGVLSGGIGVFNFSSVIIGSLVTVNATGSHPLGLLSLSSIDINGNLSANGQNAGGGLPGVGGAGGGAGGLAPFGGGEGPGGGSGKGGLPGFGDGGGFGGNGGDGFSSPGGPAYGDLHQQLQGGSGGGASANLFGAVSGGGGGGAIELGALTAIHFDHGLLASNGGNGEGGIALLAGGGSGGGLLLHAPAIGFTGDTKVSADGGGAFGGGGRILFLTASGTLDSLPSQLSANPAPTGGAAPGVIEFGQLTAVPLPAAFWLMLSALPGVLKFHKRAGNASTKSR